MIKRVCFLIFLAIMSFTYCDAQLFIKTSDLFPKPSGIEKAGELSIYQGSEADTLISRYLAGNRLLKGGMDGYRIQIYRSSSRSAREESNKTRAEFMVEFPDLPSYAEYAEPGYFLVRVGDFRTKIEGTKLLNQIRRKYPNAYMVHCIISFPDLNKN